MASSRIGLWLIGARGGVASTVVTGLVALRQRLIPPIGLTTELPDFKNLDMPDWSDFVVGGHEIRNVRLFDEAMDLATRSRAIDVELLRRVEPDLNAIDRRIRPGTLLGVGPTIAGLASDGIGVPRNETPREAVARIQKDLREFAAAENLEHTIVVNVASTEPPVADAAGLPTEWEPFQRLLDKSPCPLPASSLYAVAALDLGCSYVNFTPSLGSTPAAFDELARARRSRHMGCDGKTGETLMKSVLAPMFAHRHLEVMSWVGHNIFGNLDGRVLDDPANKRAKVASKDHLLGEILGYRPQTHVSIEHIASLGDWKTAWDHIHFRGFLGTPMVLQFIWQGCDSLLAAPLVLDLARLTDAARRRGETGPMTFLAGFFKSPRGVAEQGFVRQFEMLETWLGNPSKPNPGERN
ncbi:MAG TPA: myo-inositol-1-phosphate synthase [Planctomycetaceae bacterium]|nr:myo-inositol-1-phosphate synthase [Planctomycetaceae bacterium]